MAEKEKFIFSLSEPAQAVYTQNLITPRKYKDQKGKEQGEPKYGADFCFQADHPEIAAMKSVAVAAAKSKWGNDVDLKSIQWPWEKGEAKADRAKAKGKNRDVLRPFGLILKSRSVYAVALSILDKGQIIDLETPSAINNARERYFYDGVFTGCEVNFVPYENDRGDRGVTCYLNRVLSLGSGDRIKLSTGPSGAQVFSKYAGRQSQVDPGVGAGLDDI